MNIIKTFNQFCKENVFDLKEVLDSYITSGEFVPSDDYEENMKFACEQILYNSKADVLKPFLEEITHYVESILKLDRIRNASMLSKNDNNVISILNLVKEKYESNVGFMQGEDRIVLIFDEFAIRFDKSYVSPQTYKEMDEYSLTIACALEKKNSNIHDLLPIISLIDVNDITYEILPKAIPCDADDYNLNYEWITKQSNLRENIIGNKIDLDDNDLASDNIGYYNGKLYIIDAGNIVNSKI